MLFLLLVGLWLERKVMKWWLLDYCVCDLLVLGVWVSWVCVWLLKLICYRFDCGWLCLVFVVVMV